MNENAMAEILSRCLKCKCSLSTPEKSSKLLPCLHTMCEDCISGRTDIAEKIRRMKEEKEQKKTESVENVKKEELENTTSEKEEEIPKPEDRKEEEQVEETAADIGQSADQSEESCDKTSSETEINEKPPTDNENESKEESAPITENTSDPEEVIKEQDKPDEEKKEENPPIVETSEEQEKEEHVSETISSSENSTTPNSADTCVVGEDKKERENEENKEHAGDQPTESNAQLQESVAEDTNTNKDDEAVTEPSVPETVTVPEALPEENQKVPSDENHQENQPSQDDTSRNEESMEVVAEEEELPPPSPVPLTECPVCHEPFNPETLIDNVFIRKQAATPEVGEGSDQKCTGCESNPATSYCLQCDDWLCADCVNAHKRVRMTKDHQLTSLEEALANKSSSSVPVEVSMMCRVHPKEKLTLFCERCEVLTCRDCQLLQHQEHKYQFLQEAADSYKAKLTGSLSLMKDRRETMKRYQTEIEERLAKVKREKSELQQDILRQAETIVKAVRSSVWGVLSSLHSFTDAAAKRLSREVGDVRDLVGKFDHCITFMDGILEDGFGLPLLYSKNIVETKCRKVYHTHMEPQSLKGQLNIQYRHDVPAVLRSLPQIGAIYVNGSKYPPEKNSSQSSSSSSGSQNSSVTYRGSSSSGGGAPANVVVGGAAPSQGLPHHLAPQERSLYMQMMMGRQSHANTAPSQGPTLSLPGSRRVGNLGPAPRGWSGQQLGLPSSQGGLIGNMLGQGQSSQHQMMTARGPAFTPMRLHHRPVEPNHMSSQSTMVLGPPHRPQHSYNSLPAVYYEPAPPPLRSPVGQPQYRGAADGLHINSGGQAAMSGVRRHSMMDANSDPARPASGGHNTPERPLSGEGAASSMRVKSEPQDSMDCVITSAVFKNKKPAVMTSSTLGDLQKNLDEVIRGVPLDLGDNLEQINCGDSMGSNSGMRMMAPSLPLMTTSPNSATVSSSVTKTHTPPSVIGSSSHTSTSVSHSPTTSVVSSSGETTNTASLGGTDLGNHIESSGHQVKGYATGNSMPGFTLAAVESADPNDDYCATCHQGGDVLCCDKCPRVFHLQCHVPVLSTVPSGPFVCTLCEEGLTTESGEDGQPSDLSGKRKVTTHLSEKDVKVCERVLLELYCHPSSIPFHEPVNRAVPNYYKIITHPMDFSNIKAKLSPGHYDHYASIEAFLDDCTLVFRNCAVYNSEMSEVGKAGKIVHSFFERLVDCHMPDYASYTRHQRENPDSDVRPEAERKKRRLTPPPPHHASHGEKPPRTATPPMH